MGRGSPVCQQIREKIIEMFKNNVPQRKIGREQELYVLVSINGAITEVQVTFAKGTDKTPYHDRPWLLDLLLVTVWMILFFFDSNMVIYYHC